MDQKYSKSLQRGLRSRAVSSRLHLPSRVLVVCVQCFEHTHSILMTWLGTPSSVQSSLVASSNSASSTSNTLPSPTPSPESKSKAWIAGVVIGPIVGIALGAALMWFLLKKRRAKQSQPGPGYDQSVYPPGQAPAEKYAQAGTYAPVSPQPGEQWQHQPGSYGQYPVEAPGSTPVPPAELSQGNYHSKP
jgi:hypothetical protein